MKTKIAMIVLLGLSFAVKAQDETVNGNLTVTGNTIIEGINTSNAFRSSLLNSNYHHLVRNGGGAVLYLNQTDNVSPIFRLSSRIDTPNANVRFTVENNGNVGVGTITPLTKLDVRGIAQLGGYSGTQGGVFLSQLYSGDDYITTMSSNYSTGGLVIGYGAAGRSGQGNNQLVSTLDNFSAYRGALRFGKGTLEFLSTTSAVQTTVGDVLTTTSRFFIKEDGNVGIGTSAPQAKLQIESSSTIGGSDLTKSALLIGNTTTGIGIDQNEFMVKGQSFYFGTLTNHDIHFRTGGTNTRMTLRGDSGNFGIGTLEPSERLTVVGNAKVVGRTNLDFGNSDFLLYEDSDIGSWSLLRSNKGNGIAIIGEPDQVGISVSRTTTNVGIGTTNVPDNFKLAVAGKMIAEEVTVKLRSTWPDYVFANDYQLPTLEEVEQQIKENGHLANIPSAKEVQENGVELGDMNKKLLEKVEELTLYTIQQNKEIKKLKEENKQLKSLEERLAKLETLLQNK